jgi:hypothetical protein
MRIAVNELISQLLDARSNERIMKITNKADQVFRGQIKLVQNDHVVIGCGASSNIIFFNSIKYLEVVDG